MKTSVLLASLAVAFAAATPGLAQSAAAAKPDFPAPSPAATIKQRVGLTDIEVDYSRPSARGRVIFGGLEPYGKVWRTGANSATKIKFSTDVKLNGAAVPAGTYELFTIPDPKEWTVIIHKDMSEWGAYSYDEKNDVARLKATPVPLPTPVETFAIGFADLRDESATLYLTWEKVRVPVKLQVDLVSTLVPQIEAYMSSNAEKKPYDQAAMFYLEHGQDLKKAIAWLDEAIGDGSGQFAFYLMYHKAKVLAKTGDKTAATATAKKSIELAAKAGGSVGEEYVRLNNALLASLQ